MSCERPTERVSTLQERNEILRAAKAKYNGYINDMRSRSVEGDSEINTAIIELMNQMLINNESTANRIKTEKNSLGQMEESLKVNTNYLKTLRDRIEHNEDSKLVISNRINYSKERTESVSKQFAVYLSIIILLFLGEMAVLFFV